MNLIAIHAFANDANIQSSQQVIIQSGDRKSLIHSSNQYACISRQYTCFTNRSNHENFIEAKDIFKIYNQNN
ncbi:MAG: hypothetical protein AAFQ80_13165 [Cyanobacteria bacterium J06621_8]